MASLCCQLAFLFCDGTGAFVIWLSQIIRFLFTEYKVKINIDMNVYSLSYEITTVKSRIIVDNFNLLPIVTTSVVSHVFFFIFLGYAHRVFMWHLWQFDVLQCKIDKERGIFEVETVEKITTGLKWSQQSEQLLVRKGRNQASERVGVSWWYNLYPYRPVTLVFTWVISTFPKYYRSWLQDR